MATKLVTYKGGLFLPANVLSEMRAIDRQINGMSDDLGRSDGASTAFGRQFNAFRDDWRAFFTENQGLISRSFNTTYDQTLEFKAQADKWRTELIARGVGIVAPALPLERKTGFKWKRILLFGVFVGAIYWVGTRRRVVTFRKED